VDVPLDLVEEEDGRRVLLGAGRRGDLLSELEARGTRSVLVIGGGHADDVVETLLDAFGDASVRLVKNVRQHVPVADVEATVALVDAAGIDTVVAIGGGSAIGLGKAVARDRDVTLAAVPTTYSGSEMTAIWGVSDGTVKRTGRDPSARPSLVIYDPALTVGLPAAVTAASAFNALAHCVEALWVDDRTPATTARSVEAIDVIVDALPVVISNGHDLGGRTRLLYGAYRAGQVIGVVGTALHHRTSHVLGGRYGLDHGGMNAVLLPHVVAYNAGWGSWEEAALASVLGDNPAGRLADVARRTGAPTSLGELGMPQAGIDAVLDEVIDRVGDSNPRPPDRDSLRSLLERAWRGEPPE
jgi:maleylacetate reductase